MSSDHATAAALRGESRLRTQWSQAQALARALQQVGLSAAQRETISGEAAELVHALRSAHQPGDVEHLLAQFLGSNEEGLALMALAEALLRVPDRTSASALVRRQLAAGEWRGFGGKANSRWPQLVARALVLGQRMTGAAESEPALWQRLSAPLVLNVARRAMRSLGEHFILGTDLPAALRRARHAAGGTLFSFDLLGEGARTVAAAAAYRDSLLEAMRRLGAQAPRRDGTHFRIGWPAPLRRDSLSLKLSALEPRFEEGQRSIALRRLVPSLVAVFEAAAQGNLAVTIDAEEQDRLELSLDVLEAALIRPELAGWTGAGLAVQAYGTRALDVIDWAAALSRRLGKPLHVRLVKGAYWDTEIKRAQERGLSDYPVFTRKCATDVSYPAAANPLPNPAGYLWPQFATHNPHTLCAVRELSDYRPFEMQRLHGMGERLYAAAERQFFDPAPTRIYAPVGDHQSLLPYLVRRLLENGANSSFLSQQDDPAVTPAALAADPIRMATKRESAMPLPTQLFGIERTTARAWDLGRSESWRQLREWLQKSRAYPVRQTGPCLSGAWMPGSEHLMCSPASSADAVGRYRSTTLDEARSALQAAHAAHRAWAQLPAAQRAECLERAADMFEAAAAQLLPLLVREAGKCWADAVAELRETVDFCRYYAARARELGVPIKLPGPTGESNVLSWHGRGVFYCIAPWNFPLAIFVGQVAAALVAGNCVLAKPAPQTPLVAAAAVQILFDAGVPPAVLQFLPGDGAAVSEVVLGDSRLAGVAFTGSTATARRLYRSLAERKGPIIPFIAETGGINAMIVDSTALIEQVVDDVVTSAFRGAGQRCSALRLLCLQEEIAGATVAMLRGAMDALVVGDPSHPETDVGPLIDGAACQRIQRYLAALPADARVLHRVALQADTAAGHFVAPTLIELAEVQDLTEEVFGPVLHVVRFRAGEIPALMSTIEASGYGLTLGVHTRLSGRAEEIFARLRVGNTYVNRAMVGAVVGVQPFGGEGLSGTGPKAGGPNYLTRFAVERVLTINETAWGGNAALLGANCATQGEGKS